MAGSGYGASGMSRKIDNRTGRGKPHTGPDSTAPYPVSRMAPAIELVDLAQEIAEADSRLASMAHGKLKVIADQVRALQQEARAILDATRRDQLLHRASCNFKRQPGHTYHLYRKDEAHCYFSMLSPEEWGGSPPHRYEGSFRLENDMSWTPLEEIDRPDETRTIVERLLEGP